MALVRVTRANAAEIAANFILAMKQERQGIIVLQQFNSLERATVK
jgi:hypothetical protein